MTTIDTTATSRRALRAVLDRPARERAVCALVTEIADRYRRRADAFEALITHTAPERWTRPSPVEGWLARDVVAHVVDYSGVVLREKAGVSDVPAFEDFDDDAGAAFSAIRQRPAEIELLWRSLSEAPRVWEWQRANGWYGEPVAVPEHAPLHDRVLGRIGRDPGWTPES